VLTSAACVLSALCANCLQYIYEGRGVESLVSEGVTVWYSDAFDEDGEFDLSQTLQHRTEPYDVFRSRRIQVVIADDAPVGDSELRHIHRCSYLTELSLARTNITDISMLAIGRLRRLNKLNLRSTQITDAGLRELRTLTQLKQLDLRNTSVTSTGLKAVVGMSSLETLLLSGTAPRMKRTGRKACSRIRTPFVSCETAHKLIEHFGLDE
jgi:hypothetical protein